MDCVESPEEICFGEFAGAPDSSIVKLNCFHLLPVMLEPRFNPNEIIHREVSGSRPSGQSRAHLGIGYDTGSKYLGIFSRGTHSGGMRFIDVNFYERRSV